MYEYPRSLWSEHANIGAKVLVNNKSLHTLLLSPSEITPIAWWCKRWQRRGKRRLQQTRGNNFFKEISVSLHLAQNNDAK